MASQNDQASREQLIESVISFLPSDGRNWRKFVTSQIEFLKQAKPVEEADADWIEFVSADPVCIASLAFEEALNSDRRPFKEPPGIQYFSGVANGWFQLLNVLRAKRHVQWCNKKNSG